MTGWSTVVSEGTSGLFFAARQALMGCEVRLLCCGWDPYEEIVEGPDIDVFWFTNSEVTHLEPLLGPMLPAERCDIPVDVLRSKSMGNRSAWVPVLSRKDRFERQIEEILDASGDVSVDVVVETMEVDSSGIKTCLLDSGRHHVGQHIWLDASPRRVRRWVQTDAEIPVGDIQETLDLYLTYPLRDSLAEGQQEGGGDSLMFVTPGLWPGMAEWNEYETCRLRCPRRHAYALQSPADLYATLRQRGGLGTCPVPSPLFLRTVPGHTGTSSAYAVYNKALRALGAEAITTTDLS